MESQTNPRVSEGTWNTHPGMQSGRRVVIVHNKMSGRRRLTRHLASQGYVVAPAPDPATALQLLSEQDAAIMICDSALPDDGTRRLCDAVRSSDLAAKVYILLIAEKSERERVAESMHLGIDDVLRHPVSAAEMAIRLVVAESWFERREAMQDEQLRSHSADARLKALEAERKADEALTARIQNGLQPPGHYRRNGFGVASLSLAEGKVCGDVVGSFTVGRDTIGLYAADVSGKGVAAGLMCMNLVAHLSGTIPGRNIALKSGADGRAQLRDPAEILSELNKLFAPANERELYLTAALALIDRRNGVGRIALAGHPLPLLLPHQGMAIPLGEPGPPIGLMADRQYESMDFKLPPGGRIVMFSDGLSDACAALNAETGGERVAAGAAELATAPLSTAPQALITKMAEQHGARFTDDVSVLFAERLNAS
ncbi:MAG: SpoIIE family protein phosphatase [Pseudomonadota bacterium]